MWNIVRLCPDKAPGFADTMQHLLEEAGSEASSGIAQSRSMALPWICMQASDSLRSDGLCHAAQQDHGRLHTCPKSMLAGHVGDCSVPPAQVRSGVQLLVASAAMPHDALCPDDTWILSWKAAARARMNGGAISPFIPATLPSLQLCM